MAAALQGPLGQTILGPALLTIGSASDNQLVVSDTQVSSYHATVSLSALGYSITDLGSTNGTFVNEQRLEPNVPHLFSAGERIRIGDTTFTYEENAPATPAPPPMSTPYPYAPYGEHREYGQNPPPYSPYMPPMPSQSSFSQPTIADGVLSQHAVPPPPGGPQSFPFQPGQLASLPPAPPFYGPLPSQPQKSNGGLKIALIALAVVLVLGLGGGGAAIYVLTRPQPTINLTSNYSVGITPAGSTSTTFHITGHRFSGDSAITFLLDGNTAPGSLNAHSDADGNVSADLTITEGWSLGKHTLTAKDASDYVTKKGATLTIVPQGQAHTPGPNGAPPDDADFTVTVTLPSDDLNTAITLAVTGRVDPEGGTVCRSDAGVDGQPHTANGKSDNGLTYQVTIAQTCTGTYKNGKLSYTETVTSGKFDFDNGVSCSIVTPYKHLHMDGTYSSQTMVSGTFQEEAMDATCTYGARTLSLHMLDAKSGNWTSSSSQQSATSA